MTKLAKMRLAEIVKQLRGKITQREFARQLGTSYTAVQYWEKQIRLPGEKNLKRIAELLGWTYGELVRYIFRTDSSGDSQVDDSLEQILVRSQNLSSEQIQFLIRYFADQLVEIRQCKQELMQQSLNDKQKHNLHLLLQASLNHQVSTEVMRQSEIDPELFTDIFLRNDRNRQVRYEDMEKFSGVCCRVIQWQEDGLPEVDCRETYLGKTELLFHDLFNGESEGTNRSGLTQKH
jgi:transcriptional regulator with XRE-family HTH domain